MIIRGFIDCGIDISYPIGLNLSQSLLESLTKEITSRWNYSTTINLYGIGSSGLVLCSGVAAYLLKSNYTVKVRTIRKGCETSKSHHSRNEEMLIPEKNSVCVLIDDFVDSGKTLKRVLRVMNQFDLPKFDLFISGSYLGKGTNKSLYFPFCGDKKLMDKIKLKFNELVVSSVDHMYLHESYIYE